MPGGVRRTERICTGERWRHRPFRENRTLLSSREDDTICPPPMLPPNENAVGWRTNDTVTSLATRPEGEPDPAIEVFQADELLGIGLGSDILMVDDDAANLAAYEAALAPLGRRLVPAQSGMAAL